MIENCTDTLNSDYTKRNKEVIVQEFELSSNKVLYLQVSAITEETTLTIERLEGKLFQSKTNICQM